MNEEEGGYEGEEIEEKDKETERTGRREGRKEGKKRKGKKMGTKNKVVCVVARVCGRHDMHGWPVHQPVKQTGRLDRQDRQTSILSHATDAPFSSYSHTQSIHDQSTRTSMHHRSGVNDPGPSSPSPHDLSS